MGLPFRTERWSFLIADDASSFFSNVMNPNPFERVAEREVRVK
jgi:hypothetical protein